MIFAVAALIVEPDSEQYTWYSERAHPHNSDLLEWVDENTEPGYYVEQHDRCVGEEVNRAVQSLTAAKRTRGAKDQN